MSGNVSFRSEETFRTFAYLCNPPKGSLANARRLRKEYGSLNALLDASIETSASLKVLKRILLSFSSWLIGIGNSIIQKKTARKVIRRQSKYPFSGPSFQRMQIQLMGIKSTFKILTLGPYHIHI